MLFLEEQTLNWKSMEWKAFQKKIWRNGGGYLNKKLRVSCDVAGCLLFPWCVPYSAVALSEGGIYHSLMAAPGICQPCGRLGGIFPFLFRSSCCQSSYSSYLMNMGIVIYLWGYGEEKLEVKLSWWFPNASVSLLFKHTFAWTALVYAGQHDIDMRTDPFMFRVVAVWVMFLPFFCGCRWAHTAFFLCIFVSFWTLIRFEFCY